MEGIDAEYGTHRCRTWQEKIQSLEVTTVMQSMEDLEN
jgi:hypothetical protein